MDTVKCLCNLLYYEGIDLLHAGDLLPPWLVPCCGGGLRLDGISIYAGWNFNVPGSEQVEI